MEGLFFGVVVCFFVFLLGVGGGGVDFLGPFSWFFLGKPPLLLHFEDIVPFRRLERKTARKNETTKYSKKERNKESWRTGSSPLRKTCKRC